MSETRPKIGFVSLGCPKATVDSENILTSLQSEGYQSVGDYNQADLVVVNTCGFIDSAIDESMQAIDEALQENGKVIVTGCLGAKADQLRQAFPSLLAVTGPHARDQVMAAIHEHLPAPHDPFLDLIPKQGVRLTPRHYAYLKISEGCNHQCSFCIIPSMRGKLVSRPIDEVMQEAENLVAAGIREILVISQDTSAYGVDTRYGLRLWQGQPLQTRFYDLAEALSRLGVWIRLHYVYPYPHVDDVIPLMRDGHLLPYLDIPFQHASLPILKAMKRPGNREKVLERISAWRDICPELVIRSTFIVGFPGETDDDFEILLDFIREAGIDHAGCFTYSAVDGATANQLANHVPEAVKQHRYDTFMLTQQAVSAERLQRRVGQRLSVLVEDEDERGYLARSYADAPDIDGLTIIETDQVLPVGEFVEVTITDSDAYDCYASPL